MAKSLSETLEDRIVEYDEYDGREKLKSDVLDWAEGLLPEKENENASVSGMIIPSNAYFIARGANLVIDEVREKIAKERNNT